jgi:GTP cyclohydrolase II
VTRTARRGSLRQTLSIQLPTRWGEFAAFGFERDISNEAAGVELALAIALGELKDGAPLLCIYSSCLPGEGFCSSQCDCSNQLEIAMREIALEGRGLLIYEHHAADRRNLSWAAAILHELDILRIRLLSNNPDQYHALARAGIDVIEICEIVNDDGPMARALDLARYPRHDVLAEI